MVELGLSIEPLLNFLLGGIALHPQQRIVVDFPIELFVEHAVVMDEPPIQPQCTNQAPPHKHRVGYKVNIVS